MDYARKIGKTNETKTLTRQPLILLTTGDSLISSKEEPIAEDRRLVNWKKWLANRRGQSQRVKTQTGRDQRDQVLNSCEKIRPLTEMKTVMDFANTPLPVIPDKFRGGPEFWKVPYTLPLRNCAPEISAVASRKDLNRPPELLYVDTPELIKKEKSLLGSKRKEERWMKNPYLKQRKEQLAEEIQLLIENEPDIKNLVIEGKKVLRTRGIERRIPPITVTSPEEYEVESEENLDQTIILKIQDYEIVWNQSIFGTNEPKPDPIIWTLKFMGEVNRRDDNDIVFENKGNRVILYQWREIFFQKDLPYKRLSSPFYFNKTNGIILPGQFTKIKIWYLPRLAGIFTESWKLLTEPKLCASDLVFKFWSCAAFAPISFISTKSVEAYLNVCVRDLFIREIIGEILEDVFCDGDYLESPCSGQSTESDLFISRNPFCFYYPSLVTKLRELYREAAKEIPPSWNLSLEDLKEIVLQVEELERRERLLKRFENLYAACLRPLTNDRYRIVYSVLSSCFDCFEDESECAKNAVGLTRKIKIEKLKVGQRIPRSINTLTNPIENHDILNVLRCKTQQHGIDQNYELYKEVFYIRIYGIFKDAVDRICGMIDSFIEEGE